MNRLFVTMIAAATIASCLGGCSYEESSESKTVKRKQAFSQTDKPVLEENVGIETLAKWYFLGHGEVTIDREENAVRLAEYEGSKGVTLLSPDNYNTKYLVISFKVKPETFESVNVVFHSISDLDSGGAILIPTDYDGGFDFWTAGSVRNYIFAFHNEAHDTMPFIGKNPGMNLFAKAGARHVTEGGWHDVEIGRDGARLWIMVDGVPVVEGNDPESETLPGGSIGFRMRGTADAAASALFKDVVISLQK